MVLNLNQIKREICSSEWSLYSIYCTALRKQLSHQVQEMDVVVIILILHVEKQDTKGWLSDHISNYFFRNRSVKNLQALYPTEK